MTSHAQPQVGAVATVRNRRGVISGVRPFDGASGRLHLVDVEYNDGESPREESLLWERELNASILPPTALPDVLGAHAMPHADLTALVRACRWTAKLPYIDPDGGGPVDRLPVTAPFHAAVQVEEYQLVPLLKALRMPRVALLIADDVGLGKTVEAGLILTELLQRRRIRRVLIATPAALRHQWQDELMTKFSLPFEVVDRDSTMKLRRELGPDANPWRSHSRIITSYHYLKQPDVLEQFRVACQAEGSAAHLPWDLIVVDEAHNFSPVPIGEESDLCDMLRQVAPHFEHRVFLTATPHNGHTRSFTGLLELLDPVRFTQTHELHEAERQRIPEVLVRRLKREINARTDPKKFSERLPPQARLLQLSPAERRLSAAFDTFRHKVKTLVGGGEKKRRLAGSFAVEILGKRLLSCPTAFADSWHRCREGMKEHTEGTDSDVAAARRSVEAETVDDREAESRRRVASSTVGIWLRPLARDLHDEIREIDEALAHLGLAPAVDANVTDVDPRSDSRFDDLKSLVGTHLRKGNHWHDDERLVIFTEYKTTLDYLLRRLRAAWPEAGRVLCLYGGMDEDQRADGLNREEIKAAFNDPANPVRVLVATDAASEGINLHESARYLLHFDVPWNPSRLEQRNGRVDRYGQPRDVTTWHFMSNDDQDLAYLDFVVHKVDVIREDLGATGDVFDEATHRRLVEGQSLAEVKRILEEKLKIARGRLDVPRDDRSEIETGVAAREAAGNLAAISAELDLDATSLHETLATAMRTTAGHDCLSHPDATGRTRIERYDKSWAAVVDDYVRIPRRGAAVGPVPALAFSADPFHETVNGRPIFRPRRDTLFVHLAHPLYQRALATLVRHRFPGTGQSASRWSVARGDVPAGVDALVLLTVEEIAVNELRETFHHWTRTLRIPVASGALRDPLPHTPALKLRGSVKPGTSGDETPARSVWEEVERDLRTFVKRQAKSLTERITSQLAADLQPALAEQNERYRSRQGEISALVEKATVARLKREIEEMRDRITKIQLAPSLPGVLSDQEEVDKVQWTIERLEDELRRRVRHLEAVRDQLARDRERIVKEVLPKRHALRGEAQVLPISVEIVLREGSR